VSRPSRSADLPKLDLSKRVYKPDGVCFYLNILVKQSRSTSKINTFFFPSLPGGSRLCPVRTLKEYEARTQPLWGRETNLLVAIIKPHKAVSSSTVAIWLKSLLEASGIDTSIFGAHSVRGVSSSAAHRLIFSKLQVGVLSQLLRDFTKDHHTILHVEERCPVKMVKKLQKTPLIWETDPSEL